MALMPECKFIYNNKYNRIPLVAERPAELVLKGIRMEWLYTKAIPIEAQYLYRKAMEFSARGQTCIALNYLKQAVVIAPRYSKAYFEMGNCFARLGRYTDAIEKYQRAIYINPADSEPREKRDQIALLQNTEKTG
jgi:tetratricopeptide (TPR) repeat protein